MVLSDGDDIGLRKPLEGFDGKTPLQEGWDDFVLNLECWDL